MTHLLNKLSIIIPNSDKNNITQLLNDDKLVKDMRITIEQLKELIDLVLTQLKENGIKVHAAVL